MRDVAFALLKVEGVLETISDLLALDYPFRDSVEALSLLRADFLSLKQDLLLATNASVRVRQMQAQLTLRSIQDKLPILGIIQRSSETTGPVEFHGPFLSLVRKFLPDARVVIASDWLFSPYTYIYPDLFENQDFVFVSIPFSESDNGLISPLAGHELGHNVWRKRNLQGHLLEDANSEVHRLAQNEFQKILKEEIKTTGTTGTQLFEPSSTDKAVLWALSQCEEMFCDFLGLALFRESFLHAFEYLLAPWDFPRGVPTYPGMKDRISAQIRCAEMWGIKIPDSYAQSFKNAESNGGSATRMADLVAIALIPKIIYLAELEVSNSGLIDRPSDESILAMEMAFENGCPPESVNSLSGLLNAAWNRQIRLSSEFTDYQNAAAYANHSKMIGHNNELLLKALEILEVTAKMASKKKQGKIEDAQCLTLPPLLS